MNGFITKLDPSSGAFSHFDATNNREDLIMNLCSLPIKDPNSFYVLGVTINLVGDSPSEQFNCSRLWFKN
jgi:hypothetical protein